MSGFLTQIMPVQYRRSPTTRVEAIPPTSTALVLRKNKRAVGVYDYLFSKVDYAHHL